MDGKSWIPAVEKSEKPFCSVECDKEGRLKWTASYRRGKRVAIVQ